ncbi:MAG TPA: site-specific integrase [Dongiaceae bacterium]|nr:site-specific integrase [Dongiaceae bacterium]
MRVYKRPDSPYFRYDFTLNGVRYRGSTQTENREQAETIAAKLRTDAVTGTHFRQKESITVREAFGKYWLEIGKHATSANDIEYQLANMQRQFGRDRMLDALTDKEIAEYVARRRGMRPANAKKGSTKLVAASTVNREVELLRRVFMRARDLWKVDIGEMPAWKQLLLLEAAPIERYADLSEIERLYAAIRELRPELLPVIRFSILTAVRQENALWLRWDEVNFLTGEITIRTKSRRPGKEPLKIGITPELQVLLANERGNHAEYVFTYIAKKKRGPRQKGSRQPFSKNGWRKEWAAILAKAKIAEFRWHDLRHTAGTWFLKATNDIKLTQKFMGHKDIASTLRYVHAVEEVKTGMTAMSQLIAGPKSTPAETPDEAKPMEDNKKNAV